MTDDVFGEALYAYWKGDHRTPHVIRRDDDRADECNFEIYFSRKLYPTERKVIRFGTGKMLDIGCGAGRHVLHFQKRGFDITGIDSSPAAITVCKERGCKKVKCMNIFHNTLRKHSFDTILLFGHNIGIAGTMRRVEKLLAILRQLAAPNAVLLMTSIDVTRTRKAVHKKYQQENLKAGRCAGEFKIRVEYKNLKSDWFRWVHVTPLKIKEIAKKTGWNQEYLSEERGGEYSAVLRAV